MNKKSKITKKQLEIFKEKEYRKIDNPFGEVFREHLPKQIVLIALIVIFVVYVIINLNNIGSFFSKVVSILMPIIVGWILTYLMAPLYDLVYNNLSKNKDISKKKHAIFVNKTIATAACTLSVILVGIGLVFLFVPQLYISLTKFISKVPGYYDKAIAWLNAYEATAGDQFRRKAAIDAEQALESLIATGDIENIDFSKVFANIYSGFYFSLKMILNIFVGLIVMMYSLNLKDEFTDGLKRILFAIARRDIAQKILLEVRYANSVFSGFLVGKLLDSLIIGIICYIGCFSMRIPYTPLISVIVGVTNIIPFFGPFIGAVPSFLIILLEEPFTWRPWGFLIFVLALQQLDGNVIGPKILGDKTGVGSFWVLFSILLFGGLFGFIGMVIAVPLWAIITRLFEEFIVNRLKEKNYPLTTEDYKRLKEYNKSLKNIK